MSYNIPATGKGTINAKTFNLGSRLPSIFPCLVSASPSAKAAAVRSTRWLEALSRRSLLSGQAMLGLHHMCLETSLT